MGCPPDKLLLASSRGPVRLAGAVLLKPGQPLIHLALFPSEGSPPETVQTLFDGVLFFPFFLDFDFRFGFSRFGTE